MEPSARRLDLRSDRDAFSRGHLEGAIHAPIGTAFYLTAAGSYIGEDEPILLVLEDERVLVEAVRQLYRIGLGRIVSPIRAVRRGPGRWRLFPMHWQSGRSQRDKQSVSGE